MFRSIGDARTVSELLTSMPMLQLLLELRIEKLNLDDKRHSFFVCIFTIPPTLYRLSRSHAFAQDVPPVQ